MACLPPPSPQAGPLSTWKATQLSPSAELALQALSLGGPVEERGKSGPSNVACACVLGVYRARTPVLGYHSNLKE